jgi:hypothetical protein
MLHRWREETKAQTMEPNGTFLGVPGSFTVSGTSGALTIGGECGKLTIQVDLDRAR